MNLAALPLFDVPTLALDPADLTGWAFGYRRQFGSGVWSIAGSDSEHAGARLVRLERHILDTHERFGVKRIAFENASLGSKHENTKVYHNRVAGVIIATAAKIGATWGHYAPTTIKAHAGHGRYDKPQMIAALKRHYGLNIHSGDEADAIWILLLDRHRRGSPAVEVSKPAAKPKSGGRRRKPKDQMLF